MDSNHINSDNNHNQLQQNISSGLTPYRSAPSSYFSNLINNGNMFEDEDNDHFFNPRVSSPETDVILSKFMTNGSVADNSSPHHNLAQIQSHESQFIDSMKQEQVSFSSQQQQNMMYQNHTQSQQVVSSSSSLVIDPLMKINPPTNLIRQSSSPAGVFKHINMDDGYSMMRSMDKYRHANGNVVNSQQVKSRMAFSSVSHSLSRIPEYEGKTTGEKNGGYVNGYGGGSWDESAMLTDRFMKEFGENDHISSSENQNDKRRIHASNDLSHQLSLPTSSDELSVMEKLMQYQDNVPLRSRAKRGCATHPRSIAERVRRTRISERMRKLQDLVPNMDKQMNTADMLDLAVDYIKELQKQAETLSDHHARCTCPHTRKL